MKFNMKILLLPVLLFASLAAYGQVVNTTYYNKTLKKKVPAEAARYAEVITQYPDGTVVTEFRDLKSKAVISSSTVKVHEQFGITTAEMNGRTLHLDYNFPLVYGDSCPESTDMLPQGIGDVMKDQESAGYKAPKIQDGETIYNFLARHIFYPEQAVEHRIQGKVIVQFTISTEGSTGNIRIKRSANVLLDKEAARVVREMRFSPATVNGTPLQVCVSYPVNFRQE